MRLAEVDHAQIIARCRRATVADSGIYWPQRSLDIYRATPAARYAETVAKVVRLEARARVPIRGDPELTKRVTSLELSVDDYQGRKHLPVVTLRAA